ncbi:MAG: stage II sporulation protein E [Clostridiales bacterium]|jgi:stage II sporulation protein E|nr:stage II sporulation protein E [Clostridiales bacterium]
MAEVKRMAGNPKVYPFRRKEKEKIRVINKNSWKTCLFLGIAAFFLARAELLGALYPLAPAFLAAAVAAYRRQGLIYLIPCVLGLATVLPLNLLFANTLALIVLGLVFALYPVDGRKQWFIVPGMVLAVVAVTKGLALSLNGFENYLLLINIFDSIFAAGFSLIFLVVFGALGRYQTQRRFNMDEIVCIFIAAMGLVCGMGGLAIGTIEVQKVVSSYLVLLVAYLAGAGGGAALGAMVGIVPSLSQIVAPTIVATYAFSGLLAGIFNGFGRIGTVLGFILGHLILALYLLDAVQITAGLGAALIAGLIFFLIPQKYYRRLGVAFATNGFKSSLEDKNERLLGIALRRMRRAGWIFRDLSSSLMEISEDQENIDENNNRIILSHLCRQLCNQCSLRDICWEIDYKNTHDGILTLFKRIEAKGLASMKDMPGNFVKRCPHLKELLAVANCLYEMYCRNNYWQAQRQSSRKLLSRQLGGMAEVFDNMVGEISEYSEERELLERELAAAITKRGIFVEMAGVQAIGSKSLELWLQYGQCPGEWRCRQALTAEVERLLGRSFHIHEQHCAPQSNPGERCRYHFLAKGAYGIDIGRAQLSQNEGKDGGICGDSSDAILLEEGRQLMIISDGMGVGAKAASQSGNALSLISRLMQAGFIKDTAIDTVNAALALRSNEESFVTLDLCILDLYSGQAEFIKTGGAPSFIKRGSSVRTINSSSLPAGILTNIDKEVVEAQLQPGDIIVLASDGLLEIGHRNDLEKLVRIISAADTQTPQELAEYLLTEIIRLNEGKIRDDITIMVARLNPAA